MDFEGIILSELNQRKTNTVCAHSYVEPERAEPLKKAVGDTVI